MPRFAASAGLAFALRTSGVLLLAATALLAIRARRRGRRLRLRFVPRRAHWVQALMHAALFVGWAPHFPPVVAHVPLLLVQVLFYYAFELLLGWSRRDEARTGFGALPVVGSINLFLWFRDEWFLAQLALLATGALAKEFLVWGRGEGRRHVFNPSSLPLFVACLGLWLAGADDLTRAAEIAASQDQVSYGYLGIFALGLVVQSLFAVTLVTVGAVAALFAACQLFTLFADAYVWVGGGVPVAVYLGCHFLITDPATSPRNGRGRLAYGVLYGLSVFALYLLLRTTDGPAHYDKLLCVPLLNLLVPWFERLGGRVAGGRGDGWYVGLAALLYLGMAGAGFLTSRYPDRPIAFWERACADGRFRGCEILGSRLDASCHEGRWAHCARHAGMLERGDGVSEDRAGAGYHYQLACQEGFASACAEIPRFRAAGGDAALRAACDADDALSCLVLGVFLHEEGGEGASRALLSRACALDSAEACAFLGSRAGPAPDG